MNKDAMLKTLAETGYNVGFGAKKHFATFDIVDKVPGGLGFIGLAVGILGLVFNELAAKLPSAILVISGVAAVYISLYGHRKNEYEASGIELTRVFNELRRIYRDVQSGGSVVSAQTELQALENTFYAKSLSSQIVFSDWYAHYKFFAQMQIDWISEQRKFTWRDKFPLSLLTAVAAMVVGVIFWAVISFGPFASCISQAIQPAVKG